MNLITKEKLESGDYQCPICERWFSEGCEHFSQDTGAIKMQYRRAALDAIEAADRTWSDYYKNYPEAQEYE